ncbi:MAG: DUF3305 domain-containing protein [Betaproteobacteria bacterium]|nr:DUF3305 domain-containing protein [Betaproteobacteria bacterium]
MNAPTLPSPTGALRLAVILQRDRLHSAWQRWSWSVRDVLQAKDGGALPRCLVWGAASSQWLFGNYNLQLHRDEGEGYHLNLTAPNPSWFIWWTGPADPDCDDPRVQPGGLPAVQAITLSYNEAARWMDAGETVEVVLLPGAVANWLAAFTAMSYRPEPRRRVRPQSFLAPHERDATVPRRATEDEHHPERESGTSDERASDMDAMAAQRKRIHA